jgi:hypothetical protein
MEQKEQFLQYIYHEDLYIIDEPPATPAFPIDKQEEDIATLKVAEELVNEPSPVKYLGSNNKGILILVHDPDSEFLNEKDLGFLMRIIESGLKYSKTDIAIVNCVRFPYWQIFDEIHHSFLIAFGNHQTDALQGKSKYQVLDNDGIKVLVADALGLMAEDKEKKGQLWKALQRMFDLN